MKNLLLTLAVSGIVTVVSCGPNTKQQDDNYKSSDADVSIQQTPDQSATVHTDTGSNQSLGEGQTGEKSGSGGLPGQSLADREFIASEVISNYNEIKVLNVAVQHSTNSNIKSIAASMIADHNNAIAQLKKLAADKGVKLPADESPTGINDEVKKVSNKTGDQFNREWCKMVLTLHNKTISAYQTMNNNVVDQELKTFITGTLPKLQMHKDMVANAQKQLGS